MNDWQSVFEYSFTTHYVIAGVSFGLMVLFVGLIALPEVPGASAQPRSRTSDLLVGALAALCAVVSGLVGFSGRSLAREIDSGRCDTTVTVVEARRSGPKQGQAALRIDGRWFEFSEHVANRRAYIITQPDSPIVEGSAVRVTLCGRILVRLEFAKGEGSPSSTEPGQ